MTVTATTTDHPFTRGSRITVHGKRGAKSGNGKRLTVSVRLEVTRVTSYMVPSPWIEIEGFVLLASGKYPASGGMPVRTVVVSGDSQGTEWDWFESAEAAATRHAASMNMLAEAVGVINASEAARYTDVTKLIDAAADLSPDLSPNGQAWADIIEAAHGIVTGRIAQVTAQAAQVDTVTEAAQEETAPEAAQVGILAGTGERGEVTVRQPERAGNGTTTRWARTIRGNRYSFTAVMMPDGERRLTVSRYNGYGNDGTESGIRSGMRFGCAWTLMRKITIGAPEAAQVCYMTSGVTGGGDNGDKMECIDCGQRAMWAGNGYDHAPEAAQAETAPEARAEAAQAADDITADTRDVADVAAMLALPVGARGTGETTYASVPLDVVADGTLHAQAEAAWAADRTVAARHAEAAALGAQVAQAREAGTLAQVATPAQVETGTEAENHAAAIGQYGDNDARRAAAPHRSNSPLDTLDTVSVEALTVALGMLADLGADADTMDSVYGALGRAEARAEILQARRDAGAVRRAQADRAYRDAVAGAVEAASAACAGHLLNKAGQRAGIDPGRFWSENQAFVDAYASEELAGHFASNPRLTKGAYTEAMRAPRPEAAPKAPRSVRVTVTHAAATEEPEIPAGGEYRRFALPMRLRGPALSPVRRALAAAALGVVFTVTGGSEATVIASAPVDWDTVGEIVTAQVAEIVAARGGVTADTE